MSPAILNLACSVQTSDMALLRGSLSVPGPKPTHGNLAITATRRAFSSATLASNGTLPLAMAPRRPKCVPMTDSALWRYLTASSGLANWAATGAAMSSKVAAAARQTKVFMRFLVIFKSGQNDNTVTLVAGLLEFSQCPQVPLELVDRGKAPTRQRPTGRVFATKNKSGDGCTTTKH
ncbi:hypothetical protein [Polaromonas sp. CG9_12]|nr:hypothetical protein [Polaromonas sp. CG9_12]